MHMPNPAPSRHRFPKQSSAKALLSPCQQLLQLFRDLGWPVIHTRQSQHRAPSDCPSLKLQNSTPIEARESGAATGESGNPDNHQSMLGEHECDLLEAVAARPSELVIETPGKGRSGVPGSYWSLCALGVTHLVVIGVNTECSMMATVLEANDRGFECSSTFLRC
jgi:nicotinamidase-related amidase